MEKKYSPAGCEHKLPNGFPSWIFQSEESGNGEDFNYHVNVAVCGLCGTIKVAGYRQNKYGTRGQFNEEVDIHAAEAIDAIIKYANYIHGEEVWGRSCIKTDPDLVGQIEKFKQWKSSVITLLNKIDAYACGHADIKTGMSKVDFVIERARLYDTGQKSTAWVKATRENMRQSAILRDSVLPENYIHQWRVNGWNEKGVKFTNGILKEWWELEILNELPSKDAIIFDSQWMVGRSQERFKELGYRINDWIAWYNGWKEGRADAVEDLMKRDNQIRQSKTNP